MSSLFLVPAGPQTAVKPGDAPQRQRAIDPSESFLVQAPAGSGKTELLIQRYLRLLSLVEKPEAVQAITFTIKAAGEMRERIIAALERTVEPEEAHARVTHELARAVLARDTEKGWNLLQNPSRMRLQTIDALCAGIVAQMPWLARQGSLPKVVEDASVHYLRAAQSTVMTVERAGPHQEHIERLLMHLDNNASRVAQLIAEMLAMREQWIAYAVQTDEDSRERLEKTLAMIRQEGFRTLDNLFPAAELACLKSLFPGGWLDAADVLIKSDGKWRNRLDKSCGFPPERKADKAKCTDLLARLREVPDLEEVMAFVKRLPPERYTDDQWRLTRSILECLKVAFGELRIAFREAGEVDFTEVSQAAYFALTDAGNPTELALALDARIDHLLIDEFQDTSENQYALTQALIEGWEPEDGRTIFLVGDPMQSIYRFRQAEVGLFLETREQGIGAVQPKSLVLDANYRSAGGIVEWVNRVFTEVFPVADDRERGAIRYSPSIAARQGGEAGVQFHAFSEKQDVLEAETVVKLIHEAREADPEGTVAILVRARTHLPAVVKYLKQVGLSFRAVEIDELAERAVVRDLLSLTRAMLHLGDRLSWLSILRAPWCGLSLLDLHSLAAAQPKAFIYDLLREDLGALSTDGQARARRLRDVIERAFEERGRMPLRPWVEKAWRGLGGPQSLEDSAAMQDGMDYLDCLEQEQAGSDLRDFDGFVTRVAGLKAKADPAANEWLQIMTIHKAKGLEFDTVILPGLGRQGRRDDSKLFLSHRGVIAPVKEAGTKFDPFYQYLKEIEDRRSKHEVARQLYVATTRAKKRLHLLGFVKAFSNSVKPMPDSFLAVLWAGLTPEEQQSFIDRAAVAGESAGEGFVQAPITRLTAGWTAPAAATPVPLLPRGAEINETETPTYEWVGDSLRYVGTVVHELLVRVAKTGFEPRQAQGGQGLLFTSEEPERDFRADARRALRQLGVASEELEQTVASVESAIKGTLASTRGQWILGDHKEARGEMPIAGVIDGKIVRGTVDRTFIDERGVRWVIDFKTSSHKGGGLDAFLDEQQRRYRPQLERYGKLLTAKGEPVRLGLYFPLLDQWREWG